MGTLKPSWWLVRVTLVVDWRFLPQNFGHVVGTYEGLLQLCECRLGGGSFCRWWGHLNTLWCHQTFFPPKVKYSCNNMPIYKYTKILYQVVKVSPGGSFHPLFHSLFCPLFCPLFRSMFRPLFRSLFSPLVSLPSPLVSLPVLPLVSLPVLPLVSLPVLPLVLPLGRVCWSWYLQYFCIFECYCKNISLWEGVLVLKSTISLYIGMLLQEYFTLGGCAGLERSNIQKKLQ